MKTGFPFEKEVRNFEMVKAMNECNADEEWAREAAEEEADRQRKSEPKPELSQEEFLAWRSPRAVTQSATRLDNPLWHWLVRTRWDAYHANKVFSGPSSFDAGAMWCFERFGKSETLLPDGRIVHIGGEHEDHYDPDFFIYNDVVVIEPNGSISIYGYPVEDFSPTDFHSATLVGEEIFIIGCLGYPDQRVPGTTPVYRLAIDSMAINRVKISGENPGWIYEHSATLSDDGKTIIVSGGEQWLSNDMATRENIDQWSFNTLTGEWCRLTHRNWQRWVVFRTDRKPSRLLDVRQALWHRNHAHLGLESYWNHEDAPDFDALEMLYRLDDGSPVPIEGENHNEFSVLIDGLTVRFRESRFWIEAIVEGQLRKDRLDELQSKTLALIEKLEATACEIQVFDDDS